MEGETQYFEEYLSLTGGIINEGCFVRALMEKVGSSNGTILGAVFSVPTDIV